MGDRSIPLFKVFMPPEAKHDLASTLEGGFLAEGEKVRAFGAEVGKFIGNPYTVPVSSCTMALSIAYKLAGIGPGTEVIATPLTCIAGNSPVAMLGGTVVWADVDRSTGMVTAETIEPLLSPRTRAISLLHKEGAPAQLEAIYNLADAHGLKVIEDAAHAFGAKRAGTPIGARGDFVCFSFQAIKHITTGDGGALACANEEDYMRAKEAKWFGVDRELRLDHSVWRRDIADWGFKGNMNDVAASIGLSQMKHAGSVIDKFHRNGRRYDALLKDVANVELYERDPRDYQTYWIYSCLVADRERVEARLAERGISAMQIHPRNDRYSMFGADDRPRPNTDWIDDHEISLPCGWWVEEQDQDYIVEALAEAVK